MNEETRVGWSQSLTESSMSSRPIKHEIILMKSKHTRTKSYEIFGWTLPKIAQTVSSPESMWSVILGEFFFGDKSDTSTFDFSYFRVSFSFAHFTSLKQLSLSSAVTPFKLKKGDWEQLIKATYPLRVSQTVTNPRRALFELFPERRAAWQ